MMVSLSSFEARDAELQFCAEICSDVEVRGVSEAIAPERYLSEI
jgi:hypothetical protein